MKTILIVDDDRELLNCLRQAIILFGHRAITVQDAMSALAVIHSGAEIDLVITDYHMPGMHGLELIDRLQRIAPALPVIMCSGYADRELVDKARAGGAAVFIEKPYLLQDLNETIENVLNR